MEVSKPYQPTHKIRVVTAASLFDGHDAAINIMRRIIQATGVEVIHLGHDRSVAEVVDCAIQEDANAIALTSYQGGHMEYFQYMHDLLREKGAGHIRIFGGGGGVILPEEIERLMAYGITRIYSPDDGREMGLQGMINDLVAQSDYSVADIPLPGETALAERVREKDPQTLARLISLAENRPEAYKALQEEFPKGHEVPVLGITGTGGAGKSSLVDELVRRFLHDFPTRSIGLISVDPSKRKTGGALLGDRIRMNAIHHPNVYMRSLATRQSNLALSRYVKEAVAILKAAGFDLILLETSGIGQSDTEILEHSDLSLYVMTPEFGAATQLEKIDMLDFADLVAINKFDKRGAQDALRDVQKQYRRNHGIWEGADGDLPVYGTMASQFNDPGMNRLYGAVLARLQERGAGWAVAARREGEAEPEKAYIIPPARTRYLSEISETLRAYDTRVSQQADVAERLYALCLSVGTLAGLATPGEALALAGPEGLPGEALTGGTADPATAALLEGLLAAFETERKNLDPHYWDLLMAWPSLKKRYQAPVFTYTVRGREVEAATHTESLSHLQIPRVVLPRYQNWG